MSIPTQKIIQYFTVPHVVQSDSASPVEMTGVQSLSGHCPVKVWSKSGQSLLKSENDRNSLSSRTPVDFDQTMTGLWPEFDRIP